MSALTTRRIWAITIVWTALMGVWALVYRESVATCGPEIYQNCQIGLKVTPGLGRPGIVLLWALGVLALAVTGVTRTRSPRSQVARRATHRGFVPFAVVVFPLAVIVGFAVTSVKKTARPPAAANAVTISVLSSDVLTAGSLSGQRRHRARLTVHVRVTNLSPAELTDIAPLLLSRPPVRADRNASDTTGSLLRPVPVGYTAGGSLRFETAGAVTDEIIRTKQVRLRLAGQTFTVPCTVRSR
jgi:hypothetical protein